MTTTDPDLTAGLLPKFKVERIKGDKPGAAYFVLDYGTDPIARVALAAYANEAEKRGYWHLATDLRSDLGRTEGQQ